ncbi:hypothetical protein G6F31_019612 [Rhizopus arrhizus]|nr:hypothetical protein G6F31_019612 [Rhizopus arrhizus]
MDFNAWRRRRISEPAYRWARNALPPMSATEREAIEAGDTWWDADLFTGNPDWRKLLDVPAATLTREDPAFIDGPVAQLCAALLRHDHSAALWRAGLFALCAFRSRAADFGVLRDGGRDGHGAEFIGPG